jgi:peptide/nickel transport system substrate-binding protein
VPEPALFTILNPSYAGWWDTPAKRAALDRFNSIVDPAARARTWAEVQRLFLEEAPTVQLGEYYSLVGVSKKVQGYQPIPLAPFWNVSK